MADTSKENVSRMVAHFRKHDWAVVSRVRGTEKASDMIEALAAERDALAERVRGLEALREAAIEDIRARDREVARFAVRAVIGELLKGFMPQTIAAIKAQYDDAALAALLQEKDNVN